MLVGLQIVATIVLALAVDHNGWVWFQGGDQIWLSTQGWLLGQLELPPTELGYLWSYALTPIMWITGPTYVQALPPLVVLQVLVLGPVALLCIYDLASRIGGRLLGYWASFLWAIAPFASIPLFVDRYQERFGEQFLPQALGLTAMSDYPSMVLVLASAVFVARSLDAARVTDAVLAGLLLGAAAAVKPPNLLMGVGAALAYLVARRWRNGIAFGVAIVPSLLVLVFWKERGLGGIPALGLEETRLAVGAATTAVSVDLDQYLDFDLDHWLQQMDYMREFFFSARVAQWAPIAGLIAVLRVRRGAIAALLAGWLAAFLVVKGFSPRADIQANSFWRLLMPAWPAYLLLFAAIPLLVPTLAHRLGRPLAGTVVTTRRGPLARRRRGAHRGRAGHGDGGLLAARGAFPRTDPGRRRQLHPHLGGRERRASSRARAGRQPAHMGRRTVACGCLLPRVPLGGRRRRVREYGRASRPVLLLLRHAARERARARATRRGRPSRHDVSHRRRDELGRRPRVRGRLRVQSAGGCGRLSFSSSSAIRCARSTFSSVSREITVE